MTTTTTTTTTATTMTTLMTNRIEDIHLPMKLELLDESISNKSLCLSLAIVLSVKMEITCPDSIF